jgi:deoxyribonucleoside regulator
VVPLSFTMSTITYQTGADYILGHCADAFRAEAIRLPAPLYADPSTVASLHQDSVISRTLLAGRRAELMLFGVGAVSTSTTLFEGSFLETSMLDELVALGAVGEIGGRFFDADGTPVETELLQRVISVPLEDIRNCTKTILIASGEAKHAATLGALRGGLARLLVCDIDCARWLLSHDK